MYYQVCKINRKGEMKYYENLSERKANRLYALFKSVLTYCIFKAKDSKIFGSKWTYKRGGEK